MCVCVWGGGVVLINILVLQLGPSKKKFLTPSLMPQDYPSLASWLSLASYKIRKKETLRYIMEESFIVLTNLHLLYSKR